MNSTVRFGHLTVLIKSLLYKGPEFSVKRVMVLGSPSFHAKTGCTYLFCESGSEGNVLGPVCMYGSAEGIYRTLDKAAHRDVLSFVQIFSNSSSLSSEQSAFSRISITRGSHWSTRRTTSVITFKVGAQVWTARCLVHVAQSDRTVVRGSVYSVNLCF